jgi:poly(beta-D-mannuronate) lyase
MPLTYPLALLLLLTTTSALAGQALVPPSGYYASVQRSDDDPERCDSPPPPFTAKLVFPSKYSGSDSARATLNVAANARYRSMTEDITTMEKGVSHYIKRYMRHGNREELECGLSWLTNWAQANALLATDFNHTGKSMRKWALGSLSSAYLRLKFSESQPLAAYRSQSQVIESWFARLAEQVVRDWSDLPLKKVNNHSYWSAWSVMSTAVITNRRDLFDWAVDRFRVAASQVDAEGYLPNELKREERALAYHNYSLPPLTMIAAFAKANGVDLRGENDGALQRLAERVMAGLDDHERFARKVGSEQNTEDLEDDSKFVWLEPYCTLYRCTAKVLEWKSELEPLQTYRLGGDISEIFRQKVNSASASP